MWRDRQSQNPQLVKATWTKVYTGPGYPEDPARAERRMLAWAIKPPPWPNPGALLRCQLSDPDGMNQRLKSAPDSLIQHLRSMFPKHDRVETPFGELNIFTDPAFPPDTALITDGEQSIKITNIGK